MNIKLLAALLIASVIVVSGCTSSNKDPVRATDSSGTGNQSTTETPSEPVATPITPVPTSASSTPVPTVQTNVVTLTLYMPQGKNWDADSEIDGVEMYIVPKDSSDNLVKAIGTLNAKIWKKETDYNNLLSDVKGDMIGQWNNVVVKKLDYDSFFGAKVRLEFQNYVPTQYETGILEINFIIDGKPFAAKDTVLLSV